MILPKFVIKSKVLVNLEYNPGSFFFGFNKVIELNVFTNDNSTKSIEKAVSNRLRSFPMRWDEFQTVAIHSVFYELKGWMNEL